MRALTLLIVFLVISPLWAQQEIADAPAGNYPLRATLSPWPAVPGPCHVVVDVSPPTEGKSDLGSLKLKVLMDMPATPSMRPRLTEVPQKQTGHYEGDLQLNMPGRWRLQFLLATPNGEFRVVSLVQVGPGNPKSTGASTNPDDCGPQPLQDPNLQISCQPDPPQVGLNRLNIQLPPDTQYKKVMVGVDMAGMPMAIRPVEALARGKGRYEAELELPMSGVWQVRVDLDGQVPPPRLLNLNPAQRRPISRPLLWLTLAAALPLGLGFALRRRPLAPLIASLALAISTFATGEVIERYWPAQADMDMGNPDQSISSATPVLQATVQRLPLSVYKKYPAQVEAASEQVLTGTGPVWQVLDQGLAFQPGQSLGSVGNQNLSVNFAGVIVRRLGEVGQVMTPQQPVLVVAPIDQVKIRGRVPSSDRFRVRRGQNVDIIDGDTLIKATISAVSATSQGNEYWIESRLKNLKIPVPAMSHSGSLLPLPKPGDDGGRPGTFPLGQTCWMRCEVERLAPVLCVPKEAIFDGPNGPSVMRVLSVAGQQMVSQRQVSLGLSNDTHWEVLSGLQEGDTVVAQAQDPLAEGTLVTPASWGVGTYRDLMIPNDPAHSP